MRHLIVATLVLVFNLGAAAQTNTAQQLRLIDGTIKCVDANGKASVTLIDCLTFGLVSIGDSRQQVADVLGNPAQIIAGIDTAQIGIYPLTAGKAGDDPVLLVTLGRDTVSTLQLQGYGTTDPFSFSGMNLGDTVSVLLKHLGPPSKVVQNEQFHSELWEYEGYPFSFEIENSRIFSIMIWKPSW